MDEKEERLIIKSGTLLLFDHGYYSDYAYTGPFRVEKDIDRAREAQAYRDQWKPENEWETQPNYDGFVAYLHAGGFISDVEATSWHIGEYGEFKPE